MLKLKKPSEIKIPHKIFYGLLIFDALLVIILLIKEMFSVNIDYFYMIPTGKIIVNQGIPTINPHHIFEIKIVVQQWLYCVFLYLIEPLGATGISISAIITFSGLIFVNYKILKNDDTPRALSITVAILALTLPVLYVPFQLLAVRPEALTILLTLIEILCIERYLKTNKLAYIYTLPFLMLIEINAHGALWPIHYIALLPYLAPNVLRHFCIKTKIDKKQWKHIGITILLMTGAMFINPYGIDMPAYLINTFLSKTFDYMSINELEVQSILSLPAVYTMCILGGLCYILFKKKQNSFVVYAIIGYTILSVMYARNNIFFCIALLYLLREILNILQTNQKFKDIMQEEATALKQQNTLQHTIIACIIGAICLCYAIPFLTTENIASTTFMPTQIIQYLNENTTKDTHIYTSHNSGPFLEYEGYNKLYTDSRPEIYMKKINQTEDVLIEYRKFAMLRMAKETPSDEEYEEYINRYGFKYFIVSNDPGLKNYLDLHPDKYEYIMSEDSTSYPFQLYKKLETNDPKDQITQT